MKKKEHYYYQRKQLGLKRLTAIAATRRWQFHVPFFSKEPKIVLVVKKHVKQTDDCRSKEKETERTLSSLNTKQRMKEKGKKEMKKEKKMDWISRELAGNQRGRLSPCCSHVKVEQRRPVRERGLWINARKKQGFVLAILNRAPTQFSGMSSTASSGMEGM